MTEAPSLQEDINSFDISYYYTTITIFHECLHDFGLTAKATGKYLFHQINIYSLTRKTIPSIFKWQKTFFAQNIKNTIMIFFLQPIPGAHDGKGGP
jgi:hypothetical protein